MYYRSIDEDDYSNDVEDIIIASVFYNDPKDPRSAIFVYFTSLHTGIIRRCLKYIDIKLVFLHINNFIFYRYDFQFPSFQLLKYISKLHVRRNKTYSCLTRKFFFFQLIVGYSNNRLYLLSNNNGYLKYLTSISCPGIARR